MSEYPFIPDWLDPATAEWCAELCESMATRLMFHPATETAAHQGASLSAQAIRNCMKARRSTAPLAPRLSLVKG